jgi:UDP-2,3-diacylglucosamine hydrolase
VLIENIREGAIFIADAHYPHYGNEFLTLLQKIDKREILTPQLFLMGDVFDLLFGYSNYIKIFSSQAINLLQKISKDIETYYLEGNHDFCLKEIFPDVKVYRRELQPIRFRLGSQDVYLSHGDLYKTGFGYNLYCKVLRNRYTLKGLRVFERRIIDSRLKKLRLKNICHEFIDFQKKADKIKRYYPKESLIIEGHFHQGKIFGNYISLPSLACQGEVGIVVEDRVVFKKLNSI